MESLQEADISIVVSCVQHQLSSLSASHGVSTPDFRVFGIL